VTWPGEERDVARRDSALGARHQRRCVAVRLDAGTLRLLDPVRTLGATLLDPTRPLAGDPEEDAVIRSVLGTVLRARVTRPDLASVVSLLSARSLDLATGVLDLPATTPGPSPTSDRVPRERVILDPGTSLLWGYLRLLRQDCRGRAERGDRLLPPGWDDPSRLREALDRALASAGLGGWLRLLRVARLEALLRGLPPVVILHRAGRLAVATAVEGSARSDSENLHSSRCARPEADRHRSADPDDVQGRKLAREVIRVLRVDPSDHVRADLATRIETVFRREADQTGRDSTAHLFLRWVAARLRARDRYRSNTVRTWAGQVSRALVILPPTVADFSEPFSEALRAALVTCATPESRRTRRAALRDFLKFIRERGHVIAPVKWTAPGLAIGREPRGAYLLALAAIRAAAEAALQEPEGLPLAVAIILGGFGGLRRAEVCALKMADVPGDTRWTVRIERTKTSWGRRFVALGPVVPAWARELLDRYWTQRRSGGDGAPWLLAPGWHGWHPDDLGFRVRFVLRRVTGARVSFHSLRRAAATWLLVGWAISEGLMDAPPEPSPVPPEGARLLLGDDPGRVLWSLARFLGHGSPAVTLARYVLGLDRIEAELVARVGDPTLSSRVVGALLRVSDRRARDLVGCTGSAVPVTVVLAAQRERLSRRAGTT